MTTATPLVSIITPSYNQAQYLEQTLRSVLAQSYTPIEYLVVDGGSQDGSVDVIRSYQDLISWWISEPDHGQAEAINKGFQRAQGEIIAWLNSDDLYLPGAVAIAVSALQADPTLGMVFGDAITIDGDGHFIHKLCLDDWGLDDLLGFRIICQPAVFMRRSVLQQAGTLDPSYHFMLDHQLWLRLARLAPIRHISEQQGLLAAARIHAGAKNVAQAAGFGQEALRILKWIEQQPDLAAIIAGRRRRIEAGAYRLNARYLLDADQPGPALRAYGQALAANPAFALKHWHRMVYALLCLLGGRGLANTYYRLRQRRPPQLTLAGNAAGWPGLALDPSIPIREVSTRAG
jgi:glycosyltransferase involved in cell wall biosynthesis